METPSAQVGKTEVVQIWWITRSHSYPGLTLSGNPPSDWVTSGKTGERIEQTGCHRTGSRPMEFSRCPSHKEKSHLVLLHRLPATQRYPSTQCFPSLSNRRETIFYNAGSLVRVLASPTQQVPLSKTTPEVTPFSLASAPAIFLLYLDDVIVMGPDLQKSASV